jgi:hypothetical protein
MVGRENWWKMDPPLVFLGGKRKEWEKGRGEIPTGSPFPFHSTFPFPLLHFSISTFHHVVHCHHNTIDRNWKWKRALNWKRIAFKSATAGNKPECQSREKGNNNDIIEWKRIHNKGKTQWKGRHNEREDTTKGKTQRKGRHNEREDTTKGKTQRKGRQNEREDRTKGKTERKDRMKGRQNEREDLMKGKRKKGKTERNGTHNEREDIKGKT